MAEMARALGFHGSRDKRAFEYVGYNSRLDELQAAALRVMLPSLDTWNEARRAAAPQPGIQPLPGTRAFTVGPNWDNAATSADTCVDLPDPSIPSRARSPDVWFNA